jgi:mono/diheme cytochrome c family protein
MAKNSGGGSGKLGKLILGFVLGIVAMVAVGFLYFQFGALPVAVTDKAFPMEDAIVSVPLHARIDREKKEPPFGTSEDVFESGAKTYRANCASCHGTPGHDVAFAKHMYPDAPQLWRKHKNGVVGVSDDEPGETYWKVAHGIRLTGMPAYSNVLSDSEMWQVSLLLKNADKDLPDPVTKILTDPAQ